MTTPGGVPNLPLGALTLETIESVLQDMTTAAIHARAAARFPGIFNGSTGGNVLDSLTPFGIITQLWAGFNSVVANADPADIHGPQDLPGLLIDFIESLPVIAQFVELFDAIMGTYTGSDPTLLEIQILFGPIRAIVNGWTTALGDLHLPDPLALIQQIPGSIPALVRGPDGALSTVGGGFTKDAEGAITFVEDGLTHLVKQADGAILSLPQVVQRITHAAGVISPLPDGGVTDVMSAGQTAHTALTSAIEQAGATVVNDIVAGAAQLGNRLIYLSNTGIYDAEQGFDNIASSLLRYLDPGTGGYNAAHLTGAINTALTIEGQALSALFNSSGAFIGEIDAAATGALNTALTFGGHALSTVLGGIEAATGDFVGTVTGEVDAAATIAGQVASTVQANAQGALDSIVQAARNDASLVNQTVADAYTELVNWWSGLAAAASGGNTASPPPASAADAVLAVGTIQEHLATIGNGAEENISIDFSTFSNGSLPAGWTTTGTSGFSIASGLLKWNGIGSGTAYYSAAPTFTDFQSITVVFQSMNSGAIPEIVGRGPGTSTLVQYQAGFGWILTGGGIQAATFTDTITFGVPYTFLLGDPATLNPRHFQLLKNGSALTVASVSSGSGTGTTTWSDDSAVTQVGAAFRDVGIGSNANAIFTVASLEFHDTVESEPSVFISTSEATSSSSYGKLATTSDQVAVNIGASGKVLIELDANSSSSNGFVSVSASGANTIAAIDDNAAAGVAGAVHATVRFSKLNPGATVFDMEYRSSSGSVTFSRRRINALAL